LTKPQKKLDGLPICPFLAKYKDNVMVVRNTDPEKIANNFALQKDIFKLQAMVVFGFWMGWDKMERMVDRLNKKLKKQDVICFMMHPDGDEDTLPIQYDMDLPLLILQRISTLERAKKKLRENTNYYKHYK
tara:strand:- start:211 stop:603 length:393 start_codon:yes stop_codon:yes gene_type:complete